MKTNRPSIHGYPTWPMTLGPRSIEIAVESMGSPEATQPMARPVAFVENLERYVKQMAEERDLKPRTLKEYRRVNMKLYRMLEDAGMETHPLRIGKREVHYLRDSIPLGEGGNFRNRQYHMDLLYAFLNWARNPNLPRLWWPKGNRTRADWLTEEQMETIRIAIEDDVELAMIFHMAGDLGMRRVEVMRAEVTDFDSPMIHVRGKGRGSFKPRELRRHPDTDLFFGRYMEYRDEVVRKARSMYPDLEEPKFLLVYHRGTRLGHLRETALDTRIQRMRDLSGVDFRGYHTLRRTCARAWWIAGAPLETISDLLGHEDLAMTKRYLGISTEDHQTAYDLRAIRQRQIREELRVKTLTSGETPALQGSWL